MGSHDRDQFDDLLDGALKRYVTFEPRTGLEGRVLARLAAADRQPKWWMRRGWGLEVAGSICAAIVVLALLRSPRPHQPVAAHRRSAPNAETATRQSRAAGDDHAARTTTSRRPEAAPLLAKKRRQPREFPTRRPLSAQETMLVEYVQRYPKDAILVAKEQDEFQKRVEQAEKEIDAGSSSDQEER